MNEGVAAGTRLLYVRTRPLSMNRGVRHAAVALVAERINAGHVQHPGILRTVRVVAPQASFRLDRWMLVYKGTAVIRMALRADHVLIGRGPQVVGQETAMHVVAVAAPDHAFIHRVVKRHIEHGLLVVVALVTELGLSRGQQEAVRLRLVNAVAAHAAEARSGMRRTLEVRVGAGMAAQAGLADLRRRQLVETANLCNVSAPFDVSLAGAVAAFAGHSLAAVFQGKAGMRIRAEFIRDFLVAGGAGLLSDIVGRVGRRPLLEGCRLLALSGSQRQPGSREPAQQQKTSHAGNESTHVHSPRTAAEAAIRAGYPGLAEIGA